MAAFFSKVFPRKKDKETSNKRNSASSLLEGRFEAVSPTVSPSAANFADSAQQLKEQGREKEKEKDSGFSLFRPRSRPVSPPPDTRKRKTAPDAPHLTLNLPVPKEQRSRALGVVFEADSNDTSTLPDSVIGERRLTPLETLVLVKACSQAIVDHGGLETLGVMHPFWYSASPEVQRKLISLFILSLAPKSPITTLSPSPSSATTNFTTELEYTRSPHDIAAVLRWALRHLRLEGDSFGRASGQWNWYQAFAEAERTSSYPTNAFTTALVPQIPPSHHQLLVATLDVVSSLASHAEHNSISGSKLSKFLGLWLLTAKRSEDGEDWSSFYARWERAGRVLEHLFLAHIRDETLRGKMPLRLTELVKGYPYHSRSPSADTTPAADDDLLPRPRFSTRQYTALFVRVETELPDAKAAKPKPHPLRLVSDALKSEVELTDAQHQSLWDTLRTAARAKDDAEPILASVDGYPSLSRIFADETTRLLSFVPAESGSPDTTIPTIRVPRPPRRRSSSLNSPTQPHVNGNGNGKGEVNGKAQHTPVSPTSPSSPVSPKDWSDFSTAGFGESTIGKDFAKTLLDTDVEVTTPPPDNKSVKKGKSSIRRSSVDSPSSESATRATELAIPPSPKPAKSKSTIVSLIKLDEAFIDFWHDALLDPIAADWPNFVVAQLKTISGVESDGKPVSWLVLEQRFVLPPPPPQTATEETAASPTGARARASSPRPSFKSDLSSRRSSTFSAAKKRLTFFASASHTITGATTKPEAKSAARRKPVKAAKISELGEILPEVEEKPEEKPVVPEKEEPKKDAAPAPAPDADAPSPAARLSPVTPTAADFPAVPVVSAVAAAAVVAPVGVEALKTEDAPAQANSTLEHKLEVSADTPAPVADKSLPPMPEPVVLAGETPGPQVVLTTSEPAALVEIPQKVDEAVEPEAVDPVSTVEEHKTEAVEPVVDAPAAPAEPEPVPAPAAPEPVAEVSAAPEPAVEEPVVTEAPAEEPVAETAPAVEEPATIEEPATVEEPSAPAPAEPAPVAPVEPASAPAEAEPPASEAPAKEPSVPVVEEVVQPVQESAPTVEEPAVGEAAPAAPVVEEHAVPAPEPEAPVAVAAEKSAAAVEESAVKEAHASEPEPVVEPVIEAPAVPVEPAAPALVEETPDVEPAVEEARAAEPAPAEEPVPEASAVAVEPEAPEEPSVVEPEPSPEQPATVEVVATEATPVEEPVAAAPVVEEPIAEEPAAPIVEELAPAETPAPKVAEEPAVPESASVEPPHAPVEESASVEESAPVSVGEPVAATAAVETTTPEVSAAPAETTTQPAEVVEKHENGTATETHEAEEKPAATEESQ